MPNSQAASLVVAGEVHEPLRGDQPGLGDQVLGGTPSGVTASLRGRCSRNRPLSSRVQAGGGTDGDRGVRWNAT